MHALFAKSPFWKKTYLGLIGLCICGVAAGLRWEASQHRPVHADEAENLYMAAKVYDGVPYRFNPEHHHGPMLNVWLTRVANLWQGKNWKQWDIQSFRLSIAGISLLSLIAVFLFGQAIGYASSSIALALAASSSLLAYYGAYVIHETFMGLYALGVFGGIALFAHRKPWWGLWVGSVATSMLLCTKVTSLIYIVSWIVSALLLIPLILGKEHRSSCAVKHLKMGALSLGLIGWITFFVYSNGFKNPQSFWDAVISPFVYQVQEGHTKPWYYYLDHLVLPGFDAPYWTHDSLLVWGALIGAGVCAWKRLNNDRSFPILFGLFLCVSTCAQLGVFSLINYKTPWLMLVPWIQLAMVGGLGMGALLRHLGKYSGVFWLLLIIGFAWQTTASRTLVGRYHSDRHNPLAYVPTHENIEPIETFIQTSSTTQKVSIYGKFMWPIPWYVRHLSWSLDTNWSELPNDSRTLVIDGSVYEAHAKELNEHYDLYPYSLRSQFVVYVCFAKTTHD